MKVKWTDFYPYIEIEGLKELINEKVSFLDILDKYNIEYIAAFANAFSHKAKCPFHSNGDERTPSFYISTENNTFHCFGCSANNTMIGFISMMEGCPHEVVLSRLAKTIGITKDTNIEELNITKKERTIFIEEIEDSVLKATVLIRDFIKTIDSQQDRAKALTWAEKQFKVFDEFLEQTDKTTADKAQEKYEKIKKQLNKKTKV